jgi:PRTRC genetic system protein A
MKEEIEMSKPFLDSLKKGKVKHPEGLVTPSVTAKSKGIAPYKGVFPSVEAARASDKVISLIPARDGRVYEMRRTELGEFIAPKHNVVDFAEVRAGFVPALPLIPKELTGQIISFFRCFMHGEEEYEALAYIYWDRQEEEFVAFVPKQKASKSHVDTTLPGNSLPEDRYLHYADIHSHNSMAAKFSDIDDQDEKATRLYIVLGHLDRFYPAISVRISCGGSFVELDPETVLEGLGENFPTAWLERVETMDTVKSPTSKRGSFQRMLENLAHLEAEA